MDIRKDIEMDRKEILELETSSWQSKSMDCRQTSTSGTTGESHGVYSSSPFNLSVLQNPNIARCGGILVLWKPGCRGGRLEGRLPSAASVAG
ncbi:hypothetical protein ELI30_31355 (plasmid) [Rhizobium leguminosarum]|uniref:hypothetical protein n=1 Tax=Rhizobium leguminosarum TaxID=384 RepID=UPI001030C705|nr:hypothetical protein [Rhizobium leguminosarum]TAV43102.1 hypothetical protein ELI31_30150 [Rhizobium leguminosarum]TAV43350.1 hypothetical protein ELI32_31590 [Rhizobium leguminosarum]TAV62196.1 hypothetical protein ELI30_31355 [Rhizobium leguminosarum]TAY61257.1 hypothetical protein ELH82_29925 [Rhizobium leguminosarum]